MSLLLAGAKFLLTNSTARKGGKILLEIAFDTFKDILCQNMSLVEVAKKFSPKLKKIIHNFQKDEDAKFQAGLFKIIYLDEQSFTLNCELYFTNSEGKWRQLNINCSDMYSKDWLSPDAQIKLRNSREKIFSIITNNEEIGIAE